MLSYFYCLQAVERLVTRVKVEGTPRKRPGDNLDCTPKRKRLFPLPSTPGTRWIRADDGLETTKETTDDEILERVMTEMHGNETVDVDDEDDEEISVSDLEAKSAIETLKKYLRQKEDCTSDIGSMKLANKQLAYGISQ